MTDVRAVRPAVTHPEHGALAVFWVRDGGPNGADVGHEGPAWFYDPTGAICSDTPPASLTPDPITQGNFVVN